MRPLIRDIVAAIALGNILFTAFRVFDHPNACTELCSWRRAAPRYRIVARRADRLSPLSSMKLGFEFSDLRSERVHHIKV